MAGHSTRFKVKHIKGSLDQKRGPLFSKLAKEITVAAKMSGGDPGGNPRLHSGMLPACAQSMPKHNVERAILCGAGEGGKAATYKEMAYQARAYGCGALIIEAAMTIEASSIIKASGDIEAASDNKNARAADLPRILSKYERVAARILKWIHALEDRDCAQNVQTNFHAPEDLLAKAGSCSHRTPRLPLFSYD